MSRLTIMLGIVGIFGLPLTLGGCAGALLVGALAGAAGGGYAAAQERGVNGAVSDLDIETNVESRFSAVGPGLNEGITTTVYQGRVLLAGTAPTPQMKARAMEVASHVAGVKTLYDNVEVAPPRATWDVTKDAWITARIRSELMLDLDIRAKGDLQIDAHHTVEDIGITLGQAVARAVGDKKGIRRYGHAYVPLDEALSRVVIDFSGRPGLEYHVQFKRALIGEFDVDLVHEFFQGFANHAQVTLHIDNLRGDNAHHQCETMFKAFARALRMALEPDPRAAGTIPSTKGTL